MRISDCGLKTHPLSLNPHAAIQNRLVRRERLELSVRRLRGDCFTRLAYGARPRVKELAELTRLELAASR
jgi:hypothetical protein